MDISSIGRAVDLTYPTNRAIAVLTLSVIMGGALWQRFCGVPWLASATWGARAGLTVFLSWALCRELDPDHPMAAFIAAGMALAAALAWGLPKLALILWLIILVRVVNRTTGLPAGVIDTLGLVGLAGWLSLRGNWGYGFITALALLLDGQLSNRIRRQLSFALLSILVTAVVAIPGSGAPREAQPLTGGLVALGLSLVFLPVILATSAVDSRGDRTGACLTPVRVQAAQLLGLLAGVEAAFVEGANALVTMAPLWASVLGAFCTLLYNALTSSGLSF